MSKSSLPRMEQIFKALADGTRLRILRLLSAGEVCVCHIHESLGIPQPTASRHLAYLRRVGLVGTRRDGLWVYYRLAPVSEPVLEPVLAAVHHALTHLEDLDRDHRRLQRKTGCCLPAPSLTDASCCTPRVTRQADRTRTPSPP